MYRPRSFPPHGQPVDEGESDEPRSSVTSSEVRRIPATSNVRTGPPRPNPARSGSGHVVPTPLALRPVAHTRSSPTSSVERSERPPDEEMTVARPAAPRPSRLPSVQIAGSDDGRAPTSTCDEQTRAYTLDQLEELKGEAATAAQGADAQNVTADDLALLNNVPTVRPPTVQSDIETERRVRTQRGKSRWILWTALAAAGLTAVVLARPNWLRLHELGAVVPRLSRGWGESEAAKGPGNETARAVPAPAAVHVSVTVSPYQARLFLDGILVPNPLEVVRAADDEPHELRAEARGYRTLTRPVRLDRDLSVFFDLTALAEETAPGAVEQPMKEAATPQVRGAAINRPRNPGPLPSRASKPARDTAPGTPGSQTAPSGAPDCTPPFVIDPQGIKTYKPECI